MKHLVLLLISFNLLFPLAAYDTNDLDFSIKPKTTFSEQSDGKNSMKLGFVSPEETSLKNTKDVSLPDRKLLRGFERFPKTDAFGDTISDSFLFYRQTLTSNQKSAYDEIYKAVMNASPYIDLITRISTHEADKIIEAVYYDNPEIFWWAGNISWYYNSDGTVTRILFDYLFSQQEMNARNKEFLNMSLPVIFYANLLESDMAKIKYVHDYLCLSVDYDYEALKLNNYGGKLQTAYSAIVEYKTVCAGYSRAFAYYMQQLRIPCTVLYGSGHAWNMIEIYNDFYQMDVTWNDGNMYPPFFNLTHSEMQKIQNHAPSEVCQKIIQQHPSKSERMTYSNYFGKIPLGSPYTYQEFNNIADDIENPAYAEVYIKK